MSLEILNKVKNHKKFDKLDALLVTKPENIIYLLGFRIESDTTILMPSAAAKNLDQEIKIFLNVLEFDQIKKNIDSQPKFAEQFDLIRIPQGEENYIEKQIKNMKMSQLGFEETYVNVNKFNKWKEKFDSLELIGASEIISDARILKTQKEVETMKKAAQLGITGFKAIYDNVEEGNTEKELAALAEYEMRKAGADGTSFNTIVASGSRSAFPHALTSDKKIEKGDLIIVDIGAKLNGYCSDMTRTFIFEPGKSKNCEKKKELINLVNDGQKFGLENVNIGKKGSELDKMVRDYFKNEKEEWGDRFIHSLGHGVGIDIHEDPYLTPISEDVLKEGMCVTVEPGLYIPELGGARTEDLIVVKKEGFEILSDMEKFYY